MKEYIERTEELILAVNAGARAIENTKRYHGTTYCIDVFAPREIPYLKAAEVLRSVDEIPAADVVERKRGEWIKVGESCGVDLLECPVCHTIHAQDGDAFCRDCGADMRGEKHEAD